MDANCSQRIQFLGGSSVPASLANLYFFALIAPAKPCRSVDAAAHRRSPRALPGDALGRRTRVSGRCSIRALRYKRFLLYSSPWRLASGVWGLASGVQAINKHGLGPPWSTKNLHFPLLFEGFRSLGPPWGTKNMHFPLFFQSFCRLGAPGESKNIGLSNSKHICLG